MKKVINEQKDEYCTTADRRVTAKAVTKGPSRHMVYVTQGTSPDSVTVPLEKSG